MVRLDAARSQIARDFPNDNINLTFENDTAFLRGRVKDVTAADRVVAIAMTLGKVVNLLTVDVPGIEPQVVLKVKFANIDRSASAEYGFNFFNGSFNQQSSIGTGTPILPDEGGKFSVSSLVNILLFRPDINLVAAIQALQAKRVLELLAEPNLLAISGQAAEFLAGGEFPFPTVQPGAGQSAISLAFREYGIRLSFVPTVTPRGTIRMKIAPEVSSLDYNSAVTVLGVTVPGLSSRRVNTTVELESGQSFVIAGLLDHQTRESFSKVPGISKIPVLGKLFESKVTSRNNSELIVIITPEVVRPIPAGQAPPDLPFSSAFLSNRQNASSVSHPGQDKTGPVPITPPVDGLPVEMLRPKPENTGNAAPMFQMIPVQPTTSQEAPPVNPGIATKPPGAPR
jgi:pilus assembly protein CpaC